MKKTIYLQDEKDEWQKLNTMEKEISIIMENEGISYAEAKAIVNEYFKTK